MSVASVVARSLSSQPQTQKDLHTKEKWAAAISDILGAVPADSAGRIRIVLLRRRFIHKARAQGTVEDQSELKASSQHNVPSCGALPGFRVCRLWRAGARTSRL